MNQNKNNCVLYFYLPFFRSYTYSIPLFLSVFHSFNWHQSAGSRCKHLTVLDKRFREKNTKSIWLKQLHLLLHLNKTTMVMEATASMATIDHQSLMVKILNIGRTDLKVTFFVKMVTYGI